MRFQVAEALSFEEILLARNWNALEQKTDRPRQSCNANANTPLPPIQPLSVSELLQELHQCHLKNYCDSNDSYKQLVLVYSLEYVLLFKLPGIELVEDLAEDKCVEDHGVLHSFGDIKDESSPEL